MQNKSTREIRAVAARLLGDATYRKNLRERLKNGTAPQMEVLLYHYAYGKPKELIEHSGEIRLPTRVIFELHPDA